MSIRCVYVHPSINQNKQTLGLANQSVKGVGSGVQREIWFPRAKGLPHSCMRGRLRRKNRYGIGIRGSTRVTFGVQLITYTLYSQDVLGGFGETGEGAVALGGLA
ncbi:hypothetical protein V2G26_014335 [Clonostachys chloroleuca]